MWIGDLVLLCCVAGGTFGLDDGLVRDEETARAYMVDLNRRTAISKRILTFASWNYMTNINNETETLKIEATLEDQQSTLNNWVTLKRFNSSNFKDQTLKREFTKYNDLGAAALPETKQIELSKILSEMETVYGSAKVNVGGEEMQIEPGLTNLMAGMKNEEQMKEGWIGWRDSVGKVIKEDYIQYVELNNEVARSNGYENMAKGWTSAYEMTNFESTMDDLWSEIQPLYQKLHAFVRMKLQARFGSTVMPKDGTIPAHLLGNMWGQSWGNLFDLVRPYNASEGNEATKSMKAKGWKEIDLYKKADEFFKQIGLEGVPASFFTNSMIVKPKDREVVCHASAWDFYDGKDFRIKQCTQVQLEDFLVVHHEMGHIQYFMLYKDQPYIFRDGANPGFHEAVGDLMSLSVNTPAHLKSLGLIENDQQTEETKINFLLEKALDKISFLPFGYLVDKWRWQVFQGNITPEEYNRKWWEFRIKYQGISPPVKRGADDFDAGAKYHVAADVPYIRYFVSFLIQFQFHEFLCDYTGHKGSLHLCDISANKDKLPGNILRDALSKGSSKTWPDVMEILTAQRNISTSGLKNYFKDLEVWLDGELKGQTLGWKDATVDSYMSGSSAVEISFLLISVTAFLHLVIYNN